MKTITCREHGGTFSIEPRRGRPPVRCTTDNTCTMIVNTAANIKRKGHPATVVAPTTVSITTMSVPELKAYARSLGMSLTGIKSATQLRTAIRKYQSPLGESKPTAQEPTASVAEPVMAPRVTSNRSLPMAQAAKEHLEPLGWTCTGRAKGDLAWLTAVRGEETLTMAWEDGKLTQEQYHLWNTDRPSMNGKPTGKLSFDPDELSDKELVQKLAGMQVTWWNRLGQSEMTGTISDKVSIMHAYNGKGDETPGERVITFIDHSGGGYRSFRVDALIKIGK